MVPYVTAALVLSALLEATAAGILRVQAASQFRSSIVMYKPASASVYINKYYEKCLSRTSRICLGHQMQKIFRERNKTEQNKRYV